MAHLLSNSEIGDFKQRIKEQVTVDYLRGMYASKDRRKFVTDTFDPVCQDIVQRRPKVTAPDPAEVQNLLDELEEALLREDALGGDSMAFDTSPGGAGPFPSRGPAGHAGTERLQGRAPDQP